MSEYKVVESEMKDVQVCVQALEATEPKWKGKIEYDPEGNIHLKGYMGDDRALLPKNNKNYAPPCVIRIPKQYVQGSANDIGLSMNPDGTINMHVSEFDRGKYGKEFDNRLKQNYGQIDGIKRVVQAGDKVVSKQWISGTINTKSGPKKVKMIKCTRLMEVDEDEEEGPGKVLA